jgi:cysteine desulfurase
MCMPRDIYLDHAATTPLDPRVREVMLLFLNNLYGNPSSFHMAGKKVKDRLDEARSRVAKIIGARSDEILFTSGGTESDNLAILGFCRANRKDHRPPMTGPQSPISNTQSPTPNFQLLTSTIEHQAVLESAGHLQKKEGFGLKLIKVDKDGMVNPDDVISSLTEDTLLVSIMYANNEVGTVEPVEEIGRRIKKWKEEHGRTLPVFHTDACQAAGALPLDVNKLHVDLMSLNAGKIYGPKGVGCLYVQRGIKLQPLQFGGSQEKGVRPGTENVAGIMGFAEALEIAEAERAKERARLIPLREKLIEGILQRVPKVRVNGHRKERLPNNVNVSFMDIEGEALLLYLDAEGIFASTGSACTSASLDPSHVILALGFPYEVAHGSIRFTLGRETTEADIDRVLDVLPPLVKKLRAISPVRVDEKFFS